MKTNLFLSLMVAAILCSCSQKVCKVEGVVDDALNNSMVYVYDNVYAAEPLVLDSAKIENAKFSLTMKVETKKMKQIYFPALELGIPFVAEEGLVLIDVENGIASGTALNEELKEYHLKGKKLGDAINLIWDDENMTRDEKMDKSNALFEPFSEDIIKSLEQNFERNKNNALAAYFLINFENILKEERFVNYYNISSAETKGIERLAKSILNYAIVAETSAGKMFADFEAVVPNDTAKKARLSDFVGKGDYAVVDFWASWCGPCRREMPLMKEIHEQYGPKGLKLVAVGVWDELDKHLKASEELEVSWIQLFDTKKSMVTDLYGIKGIPTVLLLDKNGVIISRELRGAALKEKIEELYN